MPVPSRFYKKGLQFLALAVGLIAFLLVPNTFVQLLRGGTDRGSQLE